MVRKPKEKFQKRKKARNKIFFSGFFRRVSKKKSKIGRKPKEKKLASRRLTLFWHFFGDFSTLFFTLKTQRNFFSFTFLSKFFFSFTFLGNVQSRFWTTWQTGVEMKKRGGKKKPGEWKTGKIFSNLSALKSDPTFFAIFLH